MQFPLTFRATENNKFKYNHLVIMFILDDYFNATYQCQILDK